MPGERDREGRRRSGVWLPDECWAWLDANKAPGFSRSDFLEGIVYLAMDDEEDRRAGRNKARLSSAAKLEGQRSR
jgi:hypothetical protein